jgi:hypothetical protein
MLFKYRQFDTRRKSVSTQRLKAPDKGEILIKIKVLFSSLNIIDYVKEGSANYSL